MRFFLMTVGGFMAIIAAGFLILYSEIDRPSPKARQISCMSNLKQIGLGLMQYAQDNDNDLPPRQICDRDGATISWRAVLDPYTHSKGIFQCPANSVAQSQDRVGNDIERDGFNRSYAVNSAHAGAQGFGPFSDKFPGGFPISKAVRPEALLIVAESTAAYNDFNVLAPEIFGRPTSQASNAGNLFCGHKGMTNVLLCDGHVRAKQPEELLGASSSQPNPWTVDGASFSTANQAKAVQVMKYSEAQNH